MKKSGCAAHVTCILFPCDARWMDGGDLLHEFHSHVWRMGATFFGPPPAHCWFNQPATVDSGMDKENNFHGLSKNTVLTKHPMVTLSSHPVDPRYKPSDLHSEVQVKPMKRSADRTNDGLDERRQTSCVVYIVDLEATHEPSREMLQDERWACGKSESSFTFSETYSRQSMTEATRCARQRFRNASSSQPDQSKVDRCEKPRAPPQLDLRGPSPQGTLPRCVVGPKRAECGTLSGDCTCNDSSHQSKAVASC